MGQTDREAGRRAERRMAALNRRPGRGRAWAEAVRIAGNFEHPAHLAVALGVAVLAAAGLAVAR